MVNIHCLMFTRCRCVPAVETTGLLQVPLKLTLARSEITTTLAPSPLYVSIPTSTQHACACFPFLSGFEDPHTKVHQGSP